MENRLIWITRGAKIYFNEIASIIESIKNNENSTKDTIAEETSFAKEGKVRSYLTVLRAYGLVEKEKRKYFKLTKIGKVISENDPFLKNEITLWLIHYICASNNKNVIYFDLFQNIFWQNENIEHENLKKYFMKYTDTFSEKTLKSNISKEIRAELWSYEKENMNKIGIIDFETEDKEVTYFSNKNALDDEFELLTLLYYYRENYFDSSHTIEIKSLCYDESSPGITCLLDEFHIRKLLEKLDKKGYITLESRADLDQIRFIKDIKSDEVLSEIYKEVL